MAKTKRMSHAQLWEAIKVLKLELCRFMDANQNLEHIKHPEDRAIVEMEAVARLLSYAAVKLATDQDDLRIVTGCISEWLIGTAPHIYEELQEAMTAEVLH